jgi:hypothetical protein
LQRAELFDHQEPEDDDGTAGVQEVLWPLPQAHAAQRSEIIGRSRDWAILRLKNRRDFQSLNGPIAKSLNDTGA